MKKILKILLCVSFILMIGCNDGGGGGGGCDGDDPELEAWAFDWGIERDTHGAGIHTISMVADVLPLEVDDLQRVGGMLIWEETEVILCAAHPPEEQDSGISVRGIGDGFLRIGDVFQSNSQNTEDCRVDTQLQEAFDDYGLPILACLSVKACGDEQWFCAPLDQSLTITGESGNQVNLNGDWGSGCHEMDDGESEIVVTTISGSTFSQEENEWFDSATCNGTSDVTLVISGNFVLGNEVTTELNGLDVTATEMDLVITSSKGTINNPDLVDDFNADEQCGFDDWELDTPKELFGTPCSPDANDKEVLYIDDTADPDVLYSGDEDGPDDANGYPTELEPETSQERL